MKCLISRSALLLSLVIAQPALAQSQNPSIMFQQDNDQSQSLIAPEQSEMEAKCTELARQIELLRGKPQRRYIAIKRYDLECKGGTIDYDRLDSEGTSR